MHSSVTTWFHAGASSTSPTASNDAANIPSTSSATMIDNNVTKG